MILPFAGALNAFLAVFNNLPQPVSAFIVVSVVFTGITMIVRVVMS